MKAGYLAALALAIACTAAKAPAADLRALVADTQRIEQGGGKFTAVWWMPSAFWDASMSANPAVTPEGKAQVLKVLDDYTIFAVSRADIGVGGFTNPSSRDELAANSRFEVAGQVIAPLKPEELTAGAQAILAAVKPTLSAVAGQVGQIMELLIYPSRQGGKQLLDPAASGSFTYTLFDRSFGWRLPLASLLPPKFDPKTKEQFPGNYGFNPYTGAPLTTQKP